MTDWQSNLWISWNDAWTGVVAGAGIYLVVVGLTRLFTQRALTSVAAFDFPVTVAVGAIVGRTALVRASLLAGVVALLTLFTLQAVLAFLGNWWGVENGLGSPPRCLVVEGAWVRRRAGGVRCSSGTGSAEGLPFAPEALGCAAMRGVSPRGREGRRCRTRSEP